MLAWVLACALSAADGGTWLKEPVTLSADRLKVLSSEHRAIYTGHARAVQGSTVLTCDELTAHFADTDEVRSIEARGHVEAVDRDRHAQGEEADFDNRTGLLVVRGQPQAQLGRRSVQGSEVTFATTDNRLTVRNARTIAEGEKVGKGPAKIEIDSDLLELAQGQSTAAWSGHVRARKGPMALTAPQLVAHYDEGGTITRLVASGGVEVFDGDKWAKGQRAELDNARGVLVVTGKPEARQGKNRMRGTRVTFVVGSDRLEVENATTSIELEKRKGK